MLPAGAASPGGCGAAATLSPLAVLPDTLLDGGTGYYPEQQPFSKGVADDYVMNLPPENVFAVFSYLVQIPQQSLDPDGYIDNGIKATDIMVLINVKDMGFLLPLKTQIYELQNVLLHISRTFVEKNTTPPPKQQNNLLSIKQDFPTITVPGTENSACLAHSHTTGGKLSNSHQLIRFRSENRTCKQCEETFCLNYLESRIPVALALLNAAFEFRPNSSILGPAPRDTGTYLQDHWYNWPADNNSDLVAVLKVCCLHAVSIWFQEDLMLIFAPG
ncbi:hypothetical protein Anapl_07141 [Anas platyrhynchos]|uniref:Uncharacterized protein n=1 Tax=Anas platyrhynchos TaxID=8839 RepID=R0JQ33_ANAPL|nr:hypothetical protein Anapl_07141 [Anas platyrhynchos]